MTILAAGQTTNEKVKRLYEGGRDNPFNHGVVSNCGSVWCAPYVESRVGNLRDVMSTDAFITENIDPAKVEAIQRGAVSNKGRGGLGGYNNYDSLQDVEIGKM